MPYHVSITTSPDLRDWSGRTHRRPAVKVGETWNSADREIRLLGRNPRSGNFVRACAGHRDWTIVAEQMVTSLDDALEINAIFKTAVDPAHIDRVGAGECDIVLLPEPTPSDEKFAGIHSLTRDLYKAARSRMHRPPRERDDPYVTDHQREVQHDIDLHNSERHHDLDENEDRQVRAQDEGWYYED